MSTTVAHASGNGTILSAPIVSDGRTPQGIEHVSADQAHLALVGDAVTRMEFENEKTRLLAEEAQDARESSGEATIGFGSPGMMPEEVYERTMAPWRAALRRAIVANLENESRWLAAMQVRGCRVYQPRGRCEGLLTERAFGAGAYSDAVARHVLCGQFDSGDAHVFHDWSPHVLVLRIR